MGDYTMSETTAKPLHETIPLSYSIEDAWDEFAVRLKSEGKAKNTILTYRAAVLGLTKFLQGRGMPLGVEAISGEHIVEYLAHLQDVHRPSTCRTRYNSLQRLFAWLVDEREIDDNPMRRLHPPKIPFEVREGFSREELDALFVTVEGRDFLAVRDRAIFAALLSTGLRVAELCSMLAEDVVGGDHIIIRGKGDKERVVRLGHTAAVAVRRYLRRRKSSPVRELFVSVKGEPLTPHAAKQVFLRRGKEAGIKRCHPHKMRRTFALGFLDSGGTADDLRVLMGHSSQHVLRTYVAAREQERALRAHEQHDPADRLLGK